MVFFIAQMKKCNYSKAGFYPPNPKKKQWLAGGEDTKTLMVCV